MSQSSDIPSIKYLIIPSVGDVMVKFIIVMGILIGFMVLLVYTSLSNMKFVPNIHMFYDMLFDNFETSGNEMLAFIESVVQNIPEVRKHNTSVDTRVNENFENINEISAIYTNSNVESISQPSYFINIISKLYDRIGYAVNEEFSKIMAKSYVTGNTIRTTRRL